jgi:PKD repeat protein
MAYDAKSDRAILFGGVYSGTLGDTWALDLNKNTWTKMDSITSPTYRSRHAMAYDLESDRVILFDGTSCFGDTWAYDFDTNTWTKMRMWVDDPATSPPPRVEHAMAYDAESDRVIMFGGWACGGLGPTDETWSYDFNSNTWTNMEPGTKPSARGSALAYDAGSDRVVLFSGETEGGKNDETWAYDYDANTWTAMNPAARPPADYFHRMAYDVDSDRVVMFGGIYSQGNATWAYDFDTDNWTNLDPAGKPPPRYVHSMAYDSESDRTIIFGGLWSPQVWYDDTWGYDFNNNTWTKMVPVTGPPARHYHAMAYDSESDRVILFGGRWYSGGEVLFNDTWAYDFNNDTWTLMNPGTRPSARWAHALAYDAKSDRVIMFGSVIGLNDTWAYDWNTDTWTEMNPPASPPFNSLHAMAYDEESDRIILYGGGTWAYDFDNDTWTGMNPATAPGVSAHAMAYDAESDRIILFGGSGSNAYSNDTWSYDFNNDTWTLMNPAMRPSARFTPSMVFDAESDRAIMFGGYDIEPKNDTWAYDFNNDAWTLMNTATNPPARYAQALAYDSDSDRVILFGGEHGGDGTWAYQQTRNGLPSSPQNLVATAGDAQITLAWSLPEDDGGSPITNYRIYRGTVSGNLSLLIELGNISGYTDTNLTNGVTYYYQVSALNGAGEGPRSTEASATPNPANRPPEANFTFSPPTPVEGELVTFGDISTDPDGPQDILTWQWDFRDGATSAAQNPLHTFAANGTYEVRLTVTDSAGNTNSTAIDVVVEDRGPVPQFVYAPTSPREGEDVAFTDTSESYDGIVRRSWDFGDGAASTQQSPVHAYDHDSIFTVTLIVWEADGDTSTISPAIAVLDADPGATFSWTPSVPNEGVAVQFQDLSVSHDGIVGWSWDLGDGTRTESTHPSHAYVSDGTFTVSLTVRETDGDVSTVAKTVTIADLDPVAVFSFNPVNPVEGIPTIFTNASSSYDGIVSWSWNFGDGTTSTEQNPMHAYDQDGTFTAILTVREGDGDVSTRSSQITVLDSTPFADFALSPTEPRAGDPVSFTDRSVSHDGIVAWEWDFGDGTTSKLQNPVHMYDQEGRFTATLTVREADGDAVVMSKAVTVAAGGLRLSIMSSIIIGGATIAIAAIFALLVVKRRRVRNR